MGFERGQTTAARAVDNEPMLRPWTRGWTQALVLGGLGMLFAPVSVANNQAWTRGSSGFCADFSRRLPNVTLARCTQAALRDSGARTVLGRPILWRDVGAASPQSFKVLVVGGIHGDELSSVSLALHWLGLAEQPPADSPVQVLWRFVPALNADGLFMPQPRRTNANGVDLNRNFPTPRWAQEAPLYWDKRTRRDPRRWPGPKPLSEPESRFLEAQIQQFAPRLIVSIHAPYRVLDFDGPFTPPTRLGRLYLDQVGIFPGSLGNYGGVHKGIPVVTIELPNAQRTPLDSEMRQMWLDLGRWMTERLPAAQPPAVKGPVPSSAGG